MVARTDRRPASKRLETMLLRRAFTHSRKRIWIVRRTFTTPARENRWPAIIYDVAAANESRATRIAESPYLPRGGGGGYATYILRADTNRWVSSLPNWLGESRGSRSPLSTPSPSPFPPQDATLRYRDKFPRIARAFSPFSPSFRELRRAAISTRIYMYISPRRNNVHFLATRGNSVRGRGGGVREKTLSLPFFFRRKRVGASRTVAVGPRVRFACNRIAMLILSLLRGYVERERERERGRDLRVSYLSYPETSSSSSSSCRPAGCPFPVLIPFIAN